MLTNLLTDFPELTITTDRVDRELVNKPRRMDIKFIRNFMIVFGIQRQLDCLIIRHNRAFIQLHFYHLTFRKIVQFIFKRLLNKLALPERTKFAPKAPPTSH